MCCMEELFLLISQQLPWGRNLYLLGPLGPSDGRVLDTDSESRLSHSHGPIQDGVHTGGVSRQTSRSGGSWASRRRGVGGRAAGGTPSWCPRGGPTELQPHPVPAPGQRGVVLIIWELKTSNSPVTAAVNGSPPHSVLCLSSTSSTQARLDHIPVLVGLILNFLSSNNK